MRITLIQALSRGILIAAALVTVNVSAQVSNVEGILLLKMRPTKYSPYDQNAVDPYGYDFDWGY